MKNGKKISRKSLLFRVTLALVWIGLGVVLFLVNRGHTVLVDNRNVADPQLLAPDLVTVTMNKKNTLEFFRGDRDIFRVGGSSHVIRVEFSDGTPPFETSFKLPLRPDMFLLSIPKMINGVDPYIEVFYTQRESRNDDDEVPAVEQNP